MTTETKCKLIELLQPSACANFKCDIAISESQNHVSVSYYANGEYLPFFSTKCKLDSDCTAWAADTAATAARIAATAKA